jgi:hypothetical protein
LDAFVKSKPEISDQECALTLAETAIYEALEERGVKYAIRAEQWIKEGKRAVKMMRLSCHRFRSNEVRPWLSVTAYNLGNLWRRLVLPRKIENWSSTRGTTG